MARRRCPAGSLSHLGRRPAALANPRSPESDRSECPPEPVGTGRCAHGWRGEAALVFRWRPGFDRSASRMLRAADRATWKLLPNNT